ncbi:NADH-quinone oxidoreductase subunit NuoN, partial [Streptomyces albidoflavus]
MNANAVHTLWTSAAADPISKIPSPTIEYAQLAPVMIVIGAAVIGIVVEAFAPRRARYHIQLWLTVVALGAAFASVVALAVGGYATTKQTSVAMGALAVDG